MLGVLAVVNFVALKGWLAFTERFGVAYYYVSNATILIVLAVSAFIFGYEPIDVAARAINARVMA